MQKFALIFRQSPFPMTEEVKQRRAQEVTTWALQLRNAGHSLEPYILGLESSVICAEGSEAEQSGDPIVAILILDATGFDNARTIASTHPGLHYGVHIEVRSAAAPVPVPAVAASK